MCEFNYTKEVEKWGVFEVTCPGRDDGNPFTDYSIRAIFKSANEEVTIDGFYDGEGTYKVRFMPSFEGTYTFTVTGDFSDKKYNGTFESTAPSVGNKGPVRVVNTFHFAYEDGTPYYSIGTTCYVWELQSKELQQQTLETLKNNAFNKIRFCIFPKHFDYNLNEPISYPYMGTPCDSSVLTKDNFQEYNGAAEGNDWDFTRFNVEHFRHIESCIKALCDMGIQADLIVMHPYDRWGFSLMSEFEDDLYWKYVIARFAAYRNVWWSLANEYDLMEKSIEDWERYAKIICEKDKYHHLRSVHNFKAFYNYSRPWVTHCSIQKQELYRSAEMVSEWRERFQKPIVLDEITYEGNVPHGWGNISGQELVRRFWEATCRGGYAGHGETYVNESGVLWWSHGGVLHGDSPERFKFLYKILCEIPGIGLKQNVESWFDLCAIPDGPDSYLKKIQDYYLYYYGITRPSSKEYYIDDETRFEVEVIDTWEMTIEKVGIFSGKFEVALPGKEYMAVRLRKVIK